MYKRTDIYNRRSPIMPRPFQDRPGALHQSWRQTLFQINIKSAERTTNGLLCTYTRRRRRFWTELRSGNIYHDRRGPRGRLPRPISSLSLFLFLLLQQCLFEAPETRRIIPADHILRARHLRLRDHKGNCEHTIFLI